MFDPKRMLSFQDSSMISVTSYLLLVRSIKIKFSVNIGGISKCRLFFYCIHCTHGNVDSSTMHSFQNFGDQTRKDKRVHCHPNSGQILNRKLLFLFTFNQFGKFKSVLLVSLVSGADFRAVARRARRYSAVIRSQGRADRTHSRQKASSRWGNT